MSYKPQLMPTDRLWLTAFGDASAPIGVRTSCAAANQKEAMT